MIVSLGAQAMPVIALLGGYGAAPDCFGRVGDRVDDRLEEDLHALVVKGFKHVLGVLWFRRERLAVADDDQVEARDHDQELIAGPGAVVGVLGQLGITAVGVGPEAHAAMAGQAGVARDLAHRLLAEDLFAVPVAFAEQEPADAGHGPCGITAAAPARDQRQAVDRERLAVADRPFFVGNADRPHHAVAEQAADVLLRLALQGSGDGVAQHRNAGIAVLQLRPRLEQDWRLVAGDGERIVGRVELFPEVAFPAGELVMGQAVLFGVGESRTCASRGGAE